MRYLLLLADADGVATTAALEIRSLREFPGDAEVSVHFRPVRNDPLFDSAKAGGALAYRILTGEGILRSQLWVEYELLGSHINVTGRSSDLLFALALITAAWKPRSAPYPAIAATGVLELSDDPRGGGFLVGPVTHTVAKVAAAVRAFAGVADAVVFFPAVDADVVARWHRDSGISTHVQLRPVATLEEALGALGLFLEKVYFGNPFRGLEHFDYVHRAIFFGRDAQTTEVLEQLLRREAAHRPGLLVEGASGSGKSSFLRAGILAALPRPFSQPPWIQDALSRRPVHDSAGQATWQVGLLSPGADEARLAQSVRECWRKLPQLADHLGPGDGTFASLARERRCHWPDGQRFVWVLDQLEDLFSLNINAAVIDAFGLFLKALQADGVWTLACIRADAAPELKRHPSLRSVFGSDEGQYYLETMGMSGLEDVIVRPAEVAGLSFAVDPGGRRLDRVLRDDAYLARDNALPLLQFALNELYQRRAGTELTFGAYERIGGLQGSVAATAISILLAEDMWTQRSLPNLFRHLVTVDDTGRATRRYASLAEIAAEPGAERLLRRLVAARMCVTDQRDGEGVVTFAHDALLRTWPALTNWLKEEAALLQTRELAERDAHLWRQHGRSPDWLASSDKLERFKTLEVAGIDSSEQVRQFVRLSAARIRRSERVQRAVVATIALLLVLAIGAGLVATRRQHEAEARTAETLKVQAQFLTEAADQRLKGDDVAGAQAIILDVLTDRRFAAERDPSAINVFQEARAADAQVAVLSGHGDAVESAVYSPDGARIVTASGDHTARVWDARMGIELAVLRGHSAGVNCAAYSPDGARVVTASDDGTARTWDAGTGKPLLVLSGHARSVRSAAFSPDGARVVTASWDHTARVWDALTGARLLTIAGHANAIQTAAFSPDGLRIVTASHDKTARVWDAHTGRQLAALGRYDVIFESAVYSADGRRIVTASRDKIVRTWDARTGAHLTDFIGHRAHVSSAAFSPDGAWIVTASHDGTARIWDSSTGAQRAVLSGHADRLQGAAFSPDGTRVVTASLDRTARIWAARAGRQLLVVSAHGALGSARFSPDGARILTASTEKSGELWDSVTGAKLVAVLGPAVGGSAADMSPDGTRIATATSDGIARIWDARTGSMLGVLAGHGAGVLSAIYSPDNSRIVTTSDDRTARVWDAPSGHQLIVLAGHGGSVRWAAFSRDGRRIATASWDKTARIWDSSSGLQLKVLAGHRDSVSSVDYSPDSRRIATASYDGTARVWEAGTGSSLLELSGHRGVVESVAFSPDGLRIVTASLDKTVRVWDAVTGSQLEVLTGHDDLVETAAYSADGARIVSASDDGTARVWAAPVPAALAAQIIWARAAQTAPMNDAGRARWNMPADKRLRDRATGASACDLAAAAYYDPDRLAPGTAQAEVNGDIAGAACLQDTGGGAHDARLAYQAGRALLAKGDPAGARREFESAMSQSYRAAAVDLGALTAREPATSADRERAATLYKGAWADGVVIAAFALGALYEARVEASGAAKSDEGSRDLGLAWDWYRKGAAAGEPSALARVAAQRETEAATATDPVARTQLMLEAFRLYSAATERAEHDAWPDSAWIRWCHRRATLARLLALEGRMQDVANAYAAVRGGTSQ